MSKEIIVERGTKTVYRRAFDFTGLTWKKAQCEIKGSVPM